VAGADGVAHAGGLPILIQANPASISWTNNTWVTLMGSNLNSGARVQHDLYQDVQGNGVVDAADLLVASCRVEDGQTNALGSKVRPAIRILAAWRADVPSQCH
jgi:hypothetical protein